jgi:purine-binding chemotaxis protein CheW
MAKQAAAQAESLSEMQSASLARESAAHVVVFHLAGSGFGFRLAHVGEIIRVPQLAHMPLAPKSLLGLANFHGVVLPIVDLRRLLSVHEAPLGDDMRVIVTGGAVPVGFLVDRVEQLLAVPAGRLEEDNAGAGSVDPDLLEGVIKGTEGEATLKILNPGRLLRDEFSRLGVVQERASSGMAAAVGSVAPAAAPAEQKLSLVSFELDRQEYALPLDRVQEIIRLPTHVSEVARAETAVLGVVTLRDRLLPLVSLRALLGMPTDSGRKEPGKVIVLPMGSGAVGVAVDRTREILHVALGAIDPAPSLLTCGEGDAEITSICRLENGKRLVALLSPDHLFRSDLVRRVLSEQSKRSGLGEALTENNAMADEQFIIFRLRDQEYGIPIAAVEEIARLPSRLAHLPKAPSFVDGVMNLRGIVVPVFDLGRRFDIASNEAAGTQRVLVLAVGGGKTGFIVDGVSEVIKIADSAIRPAPEVSPEQMRLVGRVANLGSQNRMILLVDPAQLLDRVEADVLAKFDRSAAERKSKAS